MKIHIINANGWLLPQIDSFETEEYDIIDQTGQFPDTFEKVKL